MAVLITTKHTPVLDQEFSLPIHYKGQDTDLPMRLVTFGYIYRFVILVQDTELTVERDEEGNLRLLADHVQDAKIDAGLISAIMASLQQVL